jgi:hypothetical protein
MNVLNLKLNPTYIICFAIVILAALVQFNTYLNGDLGWHLNIAKGMLSGKQIYIDYFEVNTPLIIYITIIPALISKLFGINLILSLNIFNFSLTLLSFLSCLNVIKRSKKIDDLTLVPPFIAYSLFIIPLMFPVSEFGQKEHIFMLLLTPYLLEFILKLRPQNWPFLLACVSMLIKPFFILAYVGIFIIRVIERDKTAWREVVTLTSINIIFYLLLFFIHREYFNTIIPIALDSYKNLNSSDGSIKSQISQFYFVTLWTLHIYIIIFALSIFTFTKNSIRILPTLLMLLLLVYIQGKNFWYHYIPFFMASQLLFGIWCVEIKEGTKRFFKTVNLLIIIAGCLAAPLNSVWDNYKNQNNKHTFLYEEINKYLAQHKGQKILVMSYDLGIAFPTILYLDLKWDMKEHSLQILDGLFKFKDGINNKNKSLQYVVDDVVQALRLRPAIVLVLKPNPDIVKSKWSNVHFFKAGYNYVGFFSQYKDFNDLWEQYQFKEEMGNSNNRFEVYELKK